MKHNPSSCVMSREYTLNGPHSRTITDPKKIVGLAYYTAEDITQQLELQMQSLNQSSQLFLKYVTIRNIQIAIRRKFKSQKINKGKEKDSPTTTVNEAAKYYNRCQDKTHIILINLKNVNVKTFGKQKDLPKLDRNEWDQ